MLPILPNEFGSTIFFCYIKENKILKKLIKIMKKSNYLGLILFIAVVFILPLSAMGNFNDVSSAHPNAQGIEYVKNQGIVKGYEDGTYRPDQTINRAEFTKIIIESQFSKSEIQKCTNTPFSDVEAEKWFTNYICLAQKNQIVNGYSDKTYRPSQSISFVEAAKIISNTFDFSIQESEVWYEPFVKVLTEKKAVPTSIDQLEKNITRGEMAEMIWRLKAKITNKPTVSLLEKENANQSPESDPILPKEIPKSNRSISTTDGVKHNVPLDDILSGGPPKDGIPSIDDPKFISVKEANEFLEDEGLGISVSFNGVNRFYPNQILVWHEIVNDIVEGQPVLITYCPLCGTGIVYDPIVNGKITEFGTSGKLWNSNLVMYDRQTDSYWSQALGESIVGEMTGSRLRLLPYDNVLYKDWKRDHPNGQVLSKETGHIRNYNRDPYGSYYTDQSVFFPLDHESEEFHPKTLTFGIEIDGKQKAYVIPELEKSPASFTDELAGIPLKIDFNNDNDTIDIVRTDTNEIIVPSFGFFFSWFSIYPETEIYRAE